MWLTERTWVLIVPGSFVAWAFYIRGNWSCVHPAARMKFSMDVLNLGCRCLAFQGGTAILSMAVLVPALKWQNGNSELVALFSLEPGLPSLSFSMMVSQHLFTVLASILWFKWMAKFLGREEGTCAEDSLDSCWFHYFLGSCSSQLSTMVSCLGHHQTFCLISLLRLASPSLSLNKEDFFLPSPCLSLTLSVWCWRWTWSFVDQCLLTQLDP